MDKDEEAAPAEELEAVSFEPEEAATDPDTEPDPDYPIPGEDEEE